MFISIVIPVYNSEKTIKKLVDDLIFTLNNDNLQVVLVNDGSKDNSHLQCVELSSQYASIVTYVKLAKNFGEHNAVMAGLKYAVGDYIVIMDDDSQNPPEEVMKLVNEMINNDYDIVYSFYHKKQHHWLRNLASMINDKMANVLLNKPNNLYLSSFKCINRFLVDEILKYKGPFPYIDGLILRCTDKIGKVKVEHKMREVGQSEYTIGKLMRLWLNMFLNFSIFPLRISSILGLVFSCFSILYSFVIVILKIFLPDIPVGWPSLIIVIMMFSGVQLIILGLFGEYIGHLFLSSNQTPQFVIRDVINSKNE